MGNFLKDPAGQDSSMRLVTVMVYAAVLIGWLFVCYTKRELVPFPTEVLAMVLGTLGLKTAQRKVEASSAAVSRTVKELTQ